MTAATIEAVLATRAPMRGARRGAAGVRLDDGRVLIVGGAGSAGSGALMVASCELYEPDRDLWRVAPRLGVPRQDLAITLLADGSVMTIGGRSAGRAPLGTVERWRPGAEAWTAMAPLPLPVWGAQVVVVDDARAMLIGGFADDGPTTATWWIDRRSGVITPALPTTFPHAAHAVARSPDGAPVVVGPRAERLIDGQWRGMGGLLCGDTDASALATLPDGSVVLAGGRVVDDAESDTDETGLHAAGRNGFGPGTRFAGGGRWGLTLAVLGDHAVAVGGLTDHRAPRFVDAWELRAPDGRWRALALAEPRFLHVQVALADGSYLLVGGIDAVGGKPGTAATAAVSRLGVSA